MKGKGLRHFGEKLRRLRDEHDLSMYQMHIITEFARSTIWKWEQNNVYPSTRENRERLLDRDFTIDGSHRYC